ncbi:DUF397 domain-containing protein [Streptomyces sp. RM72]|uniref:DUF397 domain-containing protein n=1 Tax=Streptomyces sp. RM72 TaxID=1115510 RepID=UPI001B38A71D|nr:DUF397 domain-containing protein [Streptomyces sp. RM72]MBQ0890519.1 DUF397 domain-containing protein [Streptomyces sp. RM72]
MNSDSNRLGDAGSSPTWIRSSHSNGAGGECVECSAEGDRILVRDTKIGGALVASVGVAAWQAFARAVRARSASGTDL